MSNIEKLNEDQVFKQEVADDELDTVSGGMVGGSSSGTPYDSDPNNCVGKHTRNINGGDGFPNCAATVEDGSWCKTNDACHDTAIWYKGMVDCRKAHA